MRELQFNLGPAIGADPERAVRNLPNGDGAGGVTKTNDAGAPDFSRDLGQAIAAVDNLQVNADQEADKLAHGAGNIHEVSLALEKADVAMRLAIKVRNKVVDTYNEIMRMSV